MPKDMRNPCYRCPYRARVAGSVHTACTFDFAGQEVQPPRGAAHGLLHGWWFFPYNYDPVWMLEPHCNVPDTETELDPAKVRKRDDLVELLASLI